MVNSELSEISYVIQAGVTTYPIGFGYHFNENNSPQLLVKIGESVAIINVDFQLSADESEIILIPTEEEARAQSGPNDTRWMDRIVGQELLITRDIPFIQTSDYSVGRINPEQIEYDFDRAVMRDQEILHQLSDFTVDVALAESLANAAVETANEAATAANQATATANTALETANTAIVTANTANATATQASQDAVDAMADAASAVNKADAADMTATTAMEIAAEAVTIAQGAYSKTEVDNKITIINASIDANADAIQRTRADFIAADSDIHTILNNHAGELTTLHNDVDDLGDQVSGIEEKIPESASSSNPLSTAQDLSTGLFDLKVEIAGDISDATSPIQTQVEGISEEVARKQDKLTAGANITIVDNVISATGGGGDSLPDQTDNAGKFLMTDGENVSWSDKPLVNTATGTNAITIGGTASDKQEAVNIGVGSQAKENGCIAIGKNAVNNGAGVVIGQRASAGTIGRVAIGYGAKASGSYSIAIGDSVTATKTSSLAIGGSATANGAIQLGHGTNNETGTFCVGNHYNNVNYKLLDADGTIPAERMSATAGTTGQVLTKTDTGMEWQDASGGGSGDYLPTTGGEMTGLLTLNGTTKAPTAFDSVSVLRIKAETEDGTYTIDRTIEVTPMGSLYFNGLRLTGVHGLSPEDDLGLLGNSSYPWNTVYARKLHNGANISIPTEGGTLARIEDIDAIGGVGVAGQVLTKTDEGMEWQDATGGDSLPDQTDNAGKFLTTDGTTPSWSDKPLVNNADYVTSIGIGSKATRAAAVVIGTGITTATNSSVTIGANASTNTTSSVAIGYAAGASNYSIALGRQMSASAEHSIQIGCTSGMIISNTDPNTFKVYNGVDNYEMMDANGKVPLDRLTYITDQIGDISTALTAILGE